MIKTRVRKIFRDVVARKGRTALVSIAIFIGVTGTISLFSMQDILISQLQEDIKEDELAMAQISVVMKEGQQPDDLAYMKMLDEYPGVTEIQAGFEDRPIFFKTDEAEEKFEDGFAQAYIVINEDSTALIEAPSETPALIEPLRLLEGSAWPTPGADEVVIETRMADEYGLEVGDTLYLRVLSPSRAPERNGETGTVEAWTISGIAFDPYGFSPRVSIYPLFADGKYLTGLTGINDFWFRFTNFKTAEAELDSVEDLIAKQTAYSPAFSLAEDPAENQLVTQAELFATLMSTLALIALVVSGFLVINVITSLVNEQKRQIGVMKAIGATRGDNFFIYSGIAFAYGLIGVIPGVIVGIPLGNLVANLLAPQLNTLLEGFNTSPTAIIIGIVVGLAVPVIASIVPVFFGTRVQILEAMTDLGIDVNYGSGPFAKLIAALPIPITVRQGLSNVSLKKVRLAFTVITLAVAVGAFMGIFALFESLTDGIQVFFDSWNMHVGVFPAEPRDPAQITGILEANFGDKLDNVQPGFMQQIEFEGYVPEITTGGPPGIFAYGYDVTSDDPAFLFEISEGENLSAETAGNGMILASLLAANMGKHVGDTVVMKVPGNTKEFVVVGIADFPIEQAWADWQTLALLRDSTFDTITRPEYDFPAALPIREEMMELPPEASGFIKYLTFASAGDAAPFAPVLGFAPSVAQFLRIEEGEFLRPNESTVLISRDMADSAGLSVGDTLTLTPYAVGGTTVDYPIVGIFDPPATLQGSGSLPGAFVGMYWRDTANLDGATVETVPLPAGFFLTVPDDNPSVDEIDTLFDAINNTFIDQGIPIFGFNFVELTNQISEAFLTIQAILSAVAGLIALVGALGLLTTLSMSVYERQKEIGVMRSIGAGSTTVAIQFLTEGLVVGVIAWLVGIPLMIGIQSLLLNITGFNETFPFQFSLTAVIIGLIGMLVVTTLASLWPSLGAARKTVSDILRYQ
jgi:ABC-type antimicrobial peptide transport system permease subunit